MLSSGARYNLLYFLLVLDQIGTIGDTIFQQKLSRKQQKSEAVTPKQGGANRAIVALVKALARRAAEDDFQALLKELEAANDN